MSPISSCSASYKIISKILTNRLKKVIPKIISLLQRGFTLDIVIHDKILVTQEILNSFSKRRTKQGFMTIKLDMEKFYGRLE